MCFHLPLPVYLLSVTLSNSESTCDTLYLASNEFKLRVSIIFDFATSTQSGQEASQSAESAWQRGILFGKRYFLSDKDNSRCASLAVSYVVVCCSFTHCLDI